MRLGLHSLTTPPGGKFAADYARGTNVSLLDADLMDVFPDSESVNAALRTLAHLIRSRTRANVPSEKP